MPTDIDYMEMVLRKAGFDVDGDCVWQRIKKELVDGQKTTTNSAMVPCQHVWVPFIAHPPIEQCTQCDAVRRAQHQ